MARAPEEEIDPLDAYMASLELPSASPATTLISTPVSPVLTAIDWSTARRRLSGGNGGTVSDDSDTTHGGAISAVVKNRRYRRLQQLLQGEKVVQDLSQPGAMEANPDDWYFSDAMMQQRNPALFHFHVGQYLPGSAEEASKAAATASNDTQQVSSNNSSRNSDTMSSELLLSTFLLSASDRREMETRREFEQRSWGKFTGQDERNARAREKALFQQDVEEEEDESSDGEEDDEEEDMEQSEHQATVTAHDALGIAERRQLLVDLMIQRFLQGSDSEYVDYAVVDTNAELDDLEQMQRDAEDTYFDMDDE